MTAFSQNEKIIVNTSDLPPDVVQQLKQKQQTENITTELKQYSEWAGVGKEIGVAVKEGLTAVKDVAVDFSKTDVGTFTMVLIAWRFIGDDLVSAIVGLIVFFIGVIMIFWSYRKMCMPRRICIKNEGWFKAKEYTVIEVASDVNVAGAIFGHGVAFFALVGIVCAIIF